MGRDFDAAACARSVELEIDPTASNAALTYDPVEAAPCVQTVAASTGACTPLDVKKCLAAFTGALPVGAECNDSHQCAAGSTLTICRLDRHCVQPKRGALGDACMLTCIDDGACGDSMAATAFCGGPTI